MCGGGRIDGAEVLFGACVIPGAYTLLRTVALAITITMSMIHDITDHKYLVLCNAVSTSKFFREK